MVWRAMAYHVNDFVLDEHKFELRRAGTLVAIEPQVLSILLLLIENRDRLVTKDELIEKVWHGRIVSDSALTSRVKSARQALLDDGAKQAMIRTIHGRGFRFVGPVIRGTAAEPLVESGRDAAATTPLADMGKPSIAVLPFHVLGLDPTQALLGEALPHELIAELSRIRWLFVIARGSSFQFRGAGSDVCQVGTVLGVRYCLTGTLEGSESRLTITVELADTRTRGVVWGEQFAARTGDVPSMRRDIVARIVSALEVQIPFHQAYEAQFQPITHLDAWSAFHLGLRQMFRFTREGNVESHALFERALQLDPRFCRAHAGLSFAHFQNAFLGFAADPASEAIAARRFAERAVELDELDPFANFTLGRSLWLSGDVDGSLVWLNRATELSPNYAQAIYSRALAETVSGAGLEGQRDVDTAMVLSPIDPLYYAMLATRGLSHVVRGEDALAQQWVERAARSPGAHVVIGLIAAACCLLNGNEEHARAWAENVRRRHPTFSRSDFFRSLPFQAIDARGRIAQALEKLGF